MSEIRGSVDVRWLNGLGRLEWSQCVRFGRGGSHDLKVKMSLDNLHAAAAMLRDRAAHAYVVTAKVQRGRGRQYVRIDIPRDLLRSVVDAFHGVSEDDAGRRSSSTGRAASGSRRRMCARCLTSTTRARAAARTALDFA